MVDKVKKRSLDHIADAQKVMVGGVNSPVRSFKGVGGSPLVMEYGKGAKLFDVDGNSYTDYCLSWGALILGHSPRNAILAAKKTVERGTSFGATTRAEIEMAKFITRAVPSIDLIRFVNSGTEATMSAIRVSRGFTKRHKIIKFDGCYHGHFDDLLTTAGSGVANLASSSSLGIPDSHIANTLSLPYNNTQVLVDTIERHKNDIACVIIEPVAGNMGVIPAEKEFLKTLRDITKKNKIVLIFDEVMTGFRNHIGGAQAEYGIVPDLTCLGKIIGGGFPVGAYGGRKDIMECLAPLGGVYQAGTFSGNPVVMRTGLATLKLLSSDFYRSLNERAENLSRELNAFFIEKHIPVRLSHFKTMMSFRFSDISIQNYDDACMAASDQKYRELFWHLVDRGIYMPPADLEAFFISGMHTKKDLADLGTAIKSFFK
ncbi:MAG: glutamate-1-semialdehyde 2,1-aminomutase [Candidatus Omnitrophica bacterium]|nr:glutamate-1-semialdehyde 2,1-aminomutase [Candidatus Omnitrophota bacterium]